jgi:aryl-alcohol dehydrogenase-like predicted oxidoreductase
VLYVGISDTPAWVVSRAVTLAEQRGWAPFVAVQAPYSLLDRDVERDLLRWRARSASR